MEWLITIKTIQVEEFGIINMYPNLVYVTDTTLKAMDGDGDPRIAGFPECIVECQCSILVADAIRAAANGSAPIYEVYEDHAL